MIDPLYIGEPNLIYVEILERDGTAVTGATATAQVKDLAETNVGSAVTLTYNATFIPDPQKPTETIAAYVGTFSASDAATLDAATDEAANYIVDITASGYTFRRLERRAQYRGRT